MIATMFLLLSTPTVPETIHITVDGQDRQALVFRPSTPSSTVPLLFGFHGHTGNMRQASRSFGLQDAWPQALVVYPQGLPTKTYYDPSGRFNGWSPDATENNRDVRFFDALYKKLTTDYPVDPKRVFAMGHSNGAQFMYTLWAMRGDKFAAFGSCEGSGAQNANLSPKTFFITIGDQDAIVPPRLQHASLNAVFRVNGSSSNGSPFGEKGTLFPGIQPVVLWAYHGGHTFPRDCVPAMVRFFQSVP